MCETRGRDKDKLLLGMLTASQNEVAVKQLCQAAASTARTCSPFEYTIKDQPAFQSVFCRVYRVSSTRLKRTQKLLRSGVRAHASQGNVDKTRWNSYTEDTLQVVCS